MFQIAIQTARVMCDLGSTIPLLVVGSILLGVFVYWNMRVASRPVIPPHLAQNRTVVLGALIGFFDFVSQVRVLQSDAYLGLDVVLPHFRISIFIRSGRQAMVHRHLWSAWPVS